METMLALGYALEGLLGPVFRQTYWASVVIGLGQAPALTQHYFWIRFYSWSIKTTNNGGLWSDCWIELSERVVSYSIGLDLATKEA